MFGQLLDIDYPPVLDWQARQYLNGRIPGNRALGMESLRKAAEAGFVPSQSLLARCLLDGLYGVQRNPEEGIKWAQEASEQGNTDAMLTLAGAYMGGHGVDRDPEKARDLLEEAVQNGNMLAQLSLMQRDWEQNADESWDEESWDDEEEGSSPTVQMIEDALLAALDRDDDKDVLCVFEGEDDLDNEHDEDDIEDEADRVNRVRAEAAQAIKGMMANFANFLNRRQRRRKAQGYKAVAAQEEMPEAQFVLGCIYALGLGYAQNDTMASKWFRKAAKQGNGEACYALGLAYRAGTGVVQSDAKAADWISKAREAGYEARFALWDEKTPNAQAPRPTETIRLMLACSEMLQAGYSAKRIGEQFNLTTKRVRELAGALDEMSEERKDRLTGALTLARAELKSDPSREVAIEKGLERELWLLDVTNEDLDS